MTGIIAGVAVVLGLAIVMAALVWLATRARRRGTAGRALAAAMAAYDEGMHPLAYEAHVEAQQQSEQRAPAPSPDEPSLGESPPRESSPGE